MPFTKRQPVLVAHVGSELTLPTKPQPDGVLVKALARAWRWQKLLDRGVYSSVTEIAEAEKISKELREPDPAAGAAGAGPRRGDPRRVGGSAGDAGDSWSGRCRWEGQRERIIS